MDKKPANKRKLPQAEIKLGFDDTTINLRIDQIAPIKVITAAARTSQKFKQILASIREVGIIEPPAVAPDA